MSTQGSPKSIAGSGQKGSSFGDLLDFLAGPIYPTVMRPATPVVMVVLAGLINIVIGAFVLQTNSEWSWSVDEPSWLYLSIISGFSSFASVLLWGAVVSALLIIAEAIRSRPGGATQPTPANDR